MGIYNAETNCKLSQLPSQNFHKYKIFLSSTGYLMFLYIDKL